jgi:hypothetical protein
MLIEFKVENFRSFRETQTFSLIASNADKTLPSNVIMRNLPGLSNTKYLKGAAIYGGNASGKSNLLEAIHFMGTFVRNSATQFEPDDEIDVQPFLLDKNSYNKASRFEITAQIRGTRYQYGFATTRERVLEEYLIAYPKGLAQRWFERQYNALEKNYKWSNSATHFHLDRALRDKTRPNSLFLSVGPQFNNEQLTVIYEWFKNELRFINLGGEIPFSAVYTAGVLEAGEEARVSRIRKLLESADFGITGLSASHTEVLPKDLKPEHLFGTSLLDLEDKEDTLNLYEVKLSHHAEEIEDPFLKFSDESAGTRRLFALAGPWLDILENGYTVFVDELEASLHPILIREVLKLLFSEKINLNGAQVIFTTHNPILLDNSLLRRDQIWFTEKAPDGATHLYPLTDYQPRKNESLAKGYLSGRYGAIPFIPEGLKL